MREKFNQKLLAKVTNTESEDTTTTDETEADETQECILRTDFERYETKSAELTKRHDDFVEDV